RNRIGPAIRDRQKGVAGHVGDSGSETTEQIGSDAVFECVGEAREVLVSARARTRECAFGDKGDLGLRISSGKCECSRCGQNRSEKYLFHDGARLPSNFLGECGWEVNLWQEPEG